MNRYAPIALALLACLAWGCEEDAQPEYLFPAAWRADGLNVSEFSVMSDSPFEGGKCWSGEVESMETIVCRFAKKEDARAARKLGLAHVGEHTGTSLNSDVWLLTIADRNKADITGKKLNQIAKVFLNHGEVEPDKPSADKSEEGDKEPAAKGDGEAEKKSAPKK